MAPQLAPPGSSTYESSTLNVGDGTWDSSRNTFLLPNLVGFNFATTRYNGTYIVHRIWPRRGMVHLTVIRNGQSIRGTTTVPSTHPGPWDRRCSSFHRYRAHGHSHSAVLPTETRLGPQATHLVTDHHRLPDDGRLRARLVCCGAKPESHESAPCDRIDHLCLDSCSSHCWVVRP